MSVKKGSLPMATTDLQTETGCKRPNLRVASRLKKPPTNIN
jgi:hypothetical protein